MAIDYDRGVEKHVVPVTKVKVFMYLDRPGEFINAFGTEVDDELARAAGFDVDKWRKVKLKRERMAEAQRFIENELDLEYEVEEQNIVQEAEGFKLVRIGEGGYIVLDPDGNKLVPLPLPKASAEGLFKQLVPKKEPKVKDKV